MPPENKTGSSIRNQNTPVKAIMFTQIVSQTCLNGLQALSLPSLFSNYYGLVWLNTFFLPPLFFY